MYGELTEKRTSVSLLAVRNAPAESASSLGLLLGIQRLVDRLRPWEPKVYCPRGQELDRAGGCVRPI